jgi:uncharacterized protein
MPVRSWNSSVLRWPDGQSVDRAVRKWAAARAGEREDVVRIGYAGSYARGDWGPGSDVDLIILVEESDRPFEERGRDWDAIELPVPADVLVYTLGEWERMREAGTRFHREVEAEAVWVWPEATLRGRPTRSASLPIS